MSTYDRFIIFFVSAALFITGLHVAFAHSFIQGLLMTVASGILFVFIFNDDLKVDK